MLLNSTVICQPSSVHACVNLGKGATTSSFFFGFTGGLTMHTSPTAPECVATGYTQDVFMSKGKQQRQK